MNAQLDGKTRTTAALTHLDEQGRARMVDVTAKPLTRRLAVARCAVITRVDAVEALGDTRHGMDPVEAAASPASKPPSRRPRSFLSATPSGSTRYR